MIEKIDNNNQINNIINEINYEIENDRNNKINNDNKFLSEKKLENNYNVNLSPIKRIINNDNNNIEALNNYFKNWDTQNKRKNQKIKFINLHSPDMEIRGNKSKKKHIKVKFSRANISKASLGSLKSDNKSNSSLQLTKKMRIKNGVINPADYYATFLKNKNIKNISLYNKNNIDDNSCLINIIKLLNLINSIEKKI